MSRLSNMDEVWCRERQSSGWLPVPGTSYQHSPWLELGEGCQSPPESARSRIKQLNDPGCPELASSPPRFGRDWHVGRKGRTSREFLTSL